MGNLKNRKADMTVSFSWVFMIIIGTFFLILSWNIIAKYQHNSDVEYQIELKQTLRNIFNNFGRTAGIEENSLASIGNIFSDSRVEILCNDGIPILSINDNLDPNNNYLQSYPTFMTYIEQQKVAQTYLAVESFRMPFKITNLLALISQKNLIVIDKNSNFGAKLNKKFKLGSYSNLNYIYIPFDSNSLLNFEAQYVEDSNLNSIVFVTDSNKNVEVDIDKLEPFTQIVKIEEISDEYGNIIYQLQNGSTKTYSYFDYDNNLALQTMAVFSSQITFECSYNILFESMEEVFNFYAEKANYYKNSNDEICLNTFSGDDKYYQYDEIQKQLNLIKLELETNKFINAGDLSLNINVLEEQNLRLEENSCPYIY